MAKDQRTRRAEARPVEWKDLTEDQKIGARTLCELLADQDRTAGSSRFAGRRMARDDGRNLIHVLPPIEIGRQATTYLIEGDRGSGKTTLLISLLYHWQNLATGGEPWLRPELGAPELPDCQALPIGLLDLQELPAQGKLKVHLASMLRRIYEHVDAWSRVQVPLPGSPMSKPRPLQKAWDDFVRATAMDARTQHGGDTDLETFVDDISSAENDRFDLKALFCELIDLLVEHRPPEQGKTLFIVAIDDVDLKPERVLECLELTQMFSHPRVAYVLTGEEKLFRATLEQAFHAQLGSVEETTGQAKILASKFYAKVVPKSHRARLRELQLTERIAPMEDLLAQIYIEKPNAPPFDIIPAISMLDVFQASPVLALALPSTKREIVDFKSQYKESQNPNPDQYDAYKLVERIYELLRDDFPQHRDIMDPIMQTTLVTGRRFANARVDQIELDFTGLGWSLARWSMGRVQSSLEYLPAPGIALVNRPGTDQRVVALCALAATLLGERRAFSPELVRCRIHGVGDDLVTVWPFPERGRLGVMLTISAWSRSTESEAGQPFDIDRFARRYFESHIMGNDRHVRVGEGRFGREWDEIIEDVSNRLLLDDLLLLAAPEYGIPEAVRKTILVAWKKHSTSTWAHRKAMAHRARAAKLEPSTIEQIRLAFGEHDPWFNFIEYMEDDLGELGQLLDAPLVCKNPWSTHLSDYLTSDLRERLRRDSYAVDALVKVLSSEPKDDERKRLAPLTENLVVWAGTHARLSASAIIMASMWRTAEEPGQTDLRLSLAVAEIVLPSKLESALHVVAFVLAHDLTNDRQSDISHPRMAWPLVRVEEVSSGDQFEPWAQAPWGAHLDLRRMADAWNRILEASDSLNRVGDLMREFFWAQICTFQRRDYEPAPSTSWPALFEAMDAAMAATRDHKQARFRIFRDWVDTLHTWIPNSAALLPDTHIAAIATELRRRVLHVNNLSELVTALAKRMSTATARILDQRTNIRGTLDAIVEHLVREHAAHSPELFAKPPTRVSAARALIDRLETCTPLLTQDLRSMIEDSSTASLAAATTIFDAAVENGEVDALVAAWRSSAPSSQDTVLWARGRLVVKGGYDVQPAFSEANEVETDIPGVGAHYFRGAIRRLEDSLLAEVFHAMLAASVPAAEGGWFPIQWPLVRYVIANQTEITPWPCVQWPDRRDVHAQLTAWHAMLDRPKSESLSAMMREFIAATVDIYRSRQASSAYPGSWGDVLTRAGEFVDPGSSHPRDLAYREWVLQLPRFALPRTGLPLKYAADVLVRIWDNKPDFDTFRGNLIGRLDEFRQLKLNLPTPSDHPAKLAVEAADATEMARVMDELRRKYELG